MELIAFFAYRLTQENGPWDIVETCPVASFPNKVPINIFWALREDGKERKIRVGMVYPENRAELYVEYMSNGYRSDFSLYKHDALTIEVSIPGTYLLRLKVDGETVSEYPIEVVRDS